MRRILVVLLVPLLLLPGGSAQSKVEQCSKDCDPKDLVPNAPIHDGHAPVFLYAVAQPGQGFALRLDPPASRSTDSFEVDQSCVVSRWPGPQTGNGFPLDAEVKIGATLQGVAYLRSPANARAVRLTMVLEAVDVQTGAPIQQLATQTSAAFGGDPANAAASWEVRFGFDAVKTLPAWSASDQAGLRATLRLCHDPPLTPPQGWEVVSGPQQPSRLIVPTTTPLRGLGTAVGTSGAEVCVAVSFGTTFGTYDLEDESLRSWHGDATPVAFPLAIIRWANANQRWTNATGCLASDDAALKGVQRFWVQATNHQGTFAVKQEVVLPTQEASPIPTPSTAVILLIVALALQITRAHPYGKR